MALRLRHAFRFMSLISVYVPSEVGKLDMQQVIYAKQASVADSCLLLTIVLGVFSAVSP